MIIPTFSINLYGIFILIAVLAGMGYIYYALKKEIKDNKQILLFYLIYVTFAIVFGKFYTAILSGEINLWQAGLSSYGGLFGVVVGAIIFEKILPLNKKLINSTIISLPLVYSISKIGCFFAGCCGGIPYDGFLSVVYPNGLNIPQFPIQLLEAIVFLIIFFICYKLKNKDNISFITLFLIAIFKFLLDFLRYDHLEIIITKNQYFSLAIIVITFILFLKTRSVLNNK